jgi:hypothetical protein
MREHKQEPTSYREIQNKLLRLSMIAEFGVEQRRCDDAESRQRQGSVSCLVAEHYQNRKDKLG